MGAAAAEVLPMGGMGTEPLPATEETGSEQGSGVEYAEIGARPVENQHESGTWHRSSKPLFCGLGNSTIKHVTEESNEPPGT